MSWKHAGRRRRAPPRAFVRRKPFQRCWEQESEVFSLTEVELLHRANGAPYLSLSGRAQQLAAGLSFSVSLTHSDEYALAVVVAYNADGKEDANGRH